MANRYWVGGNGVWNTTSTTNWASSSGGSAGASVPTIADNVIIDNSSSSGDALVITVSGNVVCSNLTLSRTLPKTVAIGSNSSSSITCYGTAVSTGAVNSSFLIDFSGWLNIGGDNCEVSGYSVFRYMYVMTGISASINYSVTNEISEIKLANSSDLTIKNTAYVYNLKADPVSSDLVIPVVNIGYVSNQNADLYITGSSNCIDGAININAYYAGTNLYIEPSGGSAEMNIGYYNGSSWFQGTIMKMTLKPLSAGSTFTLTTFPYIQTISREAGTPSFRLKIDPFCHFCWFDNFLVEGDVSTTVYIESQVQGRRAVITKLGGGTVETDYVEVRDMQPSPDNTWISYNSTNAGNNYQWYFDDFDKPTSNLFFGSHL